MDFNFFRVFRDFSIKLRLNLTSGILLYNHLVLNPYRHLRLLNPLCKISLYFHNIFFEEKHFYFRNTAILRESHKKHIFHQYSVFVFNACWELFELFDWIECEYYIFVYWIIHGIHGGFYDFIVPRNGKTVYFWWKLIIFEEFIYYITASGMLSVGCCLVGELLMSLWRYFGRTCLEKG